jgi:hypothetical protein
MMWRSKNTNTDTPMMTTMDVATRRTRYAVTAFSILARRPACPRRLVLRRAVDEAVRSYLVKYQSSGLSWYWVSDAKEAAGPEMPVFQASIRSTAGWNRLGCCLVR